MYKEASVLEGLNFNHLYYFHIIARESSLAGATKVLNVSQPTLSQQLKQLEENLEHDLFDRSGRSLKLNKNGQYLFDYTVQIFGLAEEMLTNFAYRQKINTEMQFTIGITPSLCRTYASRLMRPLFTDPKIGVSTTEGDIKHLIESLKAQSIDFILAESPPINLIGKGVESFLIRETLNYFVCGENFQHKINSIPEDLNNVPYFKYSASNALQKNIDRYFFKHNILPTVVGESDDLNIIIAATESNHCFSIVPDIAIFNHLESKRLFKLGEFSETKSQVCALFLDDIDSSNIRSVVSQIKCQF